MALRRTFKQPTKRGIKIEPPEQQTRETYGSLKYVIASTGEKYFGEVMEHGGRFVTTIDGSYRGDSQELLKVEPSRQITNIPERLTRSSLTRAPRKVFSKMSPGRSRSTAKPKRKTDKRFYQNDRKGNER